MVFQRKRCHVVRSGMAALLALGLVSGNMGSAFADPPPWAPAHGYRHKHKHDHHHHHHHKPKPKHKHGGPDYVVAPVPFGIDMGRCNRELLGSVLGGAAGGIAGSQVGKGDGKIVAVIGGTIIGYLIGGAIGRTMDEVDQNCIGQIMEHAEDGQNIIWTNSSRNAAYEVTPATTYKERSGEYCREYTVKAEIGGREQRTYGIACRQPDGSWKIKN